MVTTLWSIIDCELLKLLRVYEDFGHVMFKPCQYATNDNKVSMGFTPMTMKNAQIDLYKIIIKTKENKEREVGMGKGMH
jgi:hypothetical protein